MRQSPQTVMCHSYKVLCYALISIKVLQYEIKCYGGQCLPALPQLSDVNHMAHVHYIENP